MQSVRSRNPANSKTFPPFKSAYTNNSREKRQEYYFLYVGSFVFGENTRESVFFSEKRQQPLTRTITLFECKHWSGGCGYFFIRVYLKKYHAHPLRIAKVDLCDVKFCKLQSCEFVKFDFVKLYRIYALGSFLVVYENFGSDCVFCCHFRCVLYESFQYFFYNQNQLWTIRFFNN